MRLALGVPDRVSERAMLQGQDRREVLREMSAVMTWSELEQMQKQARLVHVSPALLDYLQDLLAGSRSSGHGLSPRAGLALLAASRAWALMDGRAMVLPEDVQAVGMAVMGHRLTGGLDTAESLLAETAVP
jgi:MoxR-like ATPase